MDKMARTVAVKKEFRKSEYSEAMKWVFNRDAECKHRHLTVVGHQIFWNDTVYKVTHYHVALV